MCTLAAAFAPGTPLPLLVAANRDEALDRPATGPELRAGPVPFIAPLDARAGGTWLGINARGLFVGITNRYGQAPDPRRRSRGALVWEALAAPSAEALREKMGALEPQRHNPFHLLYADAQRAFASFCDGERLQHRELGPGLHVVTERSFDAVPVVEREAKLRAAWAEADPRTPADLEALRPVVTLHDVPAQLGGTCIHAEAMNYGTRSSLLLALAREPAQSRFLWAEGHPCVNPHRDRSGLLRALWA